MAEYIEREALLKRNMYGNANPIVYRTYAEELIKSAPAADVVELPLILDTGYKVRIVRRDDYGNLYTTYRMTKREARDFLERVGELTEKAKKALAEKKG